MAPLKKQPAAKIMQAVEIADGRLRLCTRPLPQPARGEVLVKVAAAGVNRPDLLQRRGLYPPPPGITDIPGLEIAGVIAAGPRRGEKICALVAGGGYAAYAVVPAGQCLPIPKGLTMLEAAALPETFFTVWRNVFDLGGLRKGETLLVHGGNSGIGTTAIQLATALGATVIATARGTKKAAACRKLGAHAIDSTAKDFAQEVERLTGGRGVDVILDMLGGDVFAKNLSIMATGGRHVSIATQTGRIGSADLGLIMRRQLTVTGSTLRAQPVAVKALIAAALKKYAWPLLSKKKIAPIIAKTFTLENAQAAHDLLESGTVTGKLVLTIQEKEAAHA